MSECELMLEKEDDARIDRPYIPSPIVLCFNKKRYQQFWLLARYHGDSERPNPRGTEDSPIVVTASRLPGVSFLPVLISFHSITMLNSQQRRIIFQHLHRASFDTLVLKLSSISGRNPNNVSSTVPLIELIMLTYIVLIYNFDFRSDSRIVQVGLS